MKTWKIKTNGVDRVVVFTPNPWTGKHKLTVNGQEIPLKRAPFQFFVGIDQPVQIGSKECRFVLLGSKADIAVDGRYVGSGKPYVPLGNMPWWAWLFVAACAAIPIVSLGGALPAVIALVGAAWCVRVSIFPTWSTPAKVLCCLGITALSWAAFGALLYILWRR